jgi:5-deoxy-glucuronate isomerase
MTAFPLPIPGPRAGFPAGYTCVTSPEAPLDGSATPLGIEFGIHRLEPDESVRETHPFETAWVLLRGRAEVQLEAGRFPVSRQDVFDEAPSAVHAGPGTRITIHSVDASEWAVIRTANDRHFSARMYFPAGIQPEYRGAGLVQNAALRNVRLIFDRTTRPDSNLVVGEVVNYPGRWSSYPPHHHDQPEIYHYRFTAPAGYGHAELGDAIVKVRDRDTVVIAPGRDHAQVSAPGYGMYYLWLIRHLPGNPYTGFTFAQEHTWTLDPQKQGWKPRDVPHPLP